MLMMTVLPCHFFAKNFMPIDWQYSRASCSVTVKVSRVYGLAMWRSKTVSMGVFVLWA